jgi:hypothetical protein
MSEQWYAKWYIEENEADGIYFFNDKTGVQTHGASQAFVKAIREEIREGYGFLPFVGAGFSVTAGIPIIQQLTNYLQRCICVALGAEDPSAELWNPRTDRWPPFIDRVRTRPSDFWLHLMRAKYDKQAALKKRGQVAYPELYLEAFGAMAEWRAALAFLSRIVLRPERSGHGTKSQPCLAAQEPDVVDACFREVMQHKRPTLNHRMLASLSSLLRIDLILTTNFDNLVERAFEVSRIPLEVFDVHIGDRLPEFTAVSPVRSIVKMHGSQRSLRADYSLDDAPSHEDRETICEYLAGKKLNAEPGQHFTRNHLILMGIGASERRTLEFVFHAYNFFDDLKVFWICYSAHEAAKIREYVRANHPALRRDATKNRCRFYVLQHTDAGLLFLHLYQSIRKSLPATGTIFPSATRLAFPPLPSHATGLKNGGTKEYTEFKDALEKLIRSTKKESKRLIVVASNAETCGIDTGSATVFRMLEGDHTCLWLDLDDIHSADGVFEAFQEAAYQRLGESDWTPLYVQKDDAHLGEMMPLKAEIRRIVESSNRPWVLFLDARETPGSNHKDSAHPNGWMDESPISDGLADTANTPATLELLRQFIAANDDDVRDRRDPLLSRLNLARDPREIKVVLLCTTGRSNLLGELRKENCEFIETDNLPTGPTTDEIVNRVIAWANDNLQDEPRRSDRRRFVQAIASMQRPRHFAFAWAKCMNQHWNITSQSDVYRNQWLDELEGIGLLHRLDGGFIWLFSSRRQGLRRCLALTEIDLDDSQTISQVSNKCRTVLAEESRAALQSWKAAAQQAEIHLSLSTWYRKVFDATGAGQAIFEAVDHLCFSAESLIRYKSLRPQSQNLGEEFIPEDERIQLAISRVAAARELLRENEFLIQTHGHPRASLRRLDFLRDYWVVRRSPLPDSIAKFIDNKHQYLALKSEIAKLQVTTAQVARAICRETGEDGDAFKRLREVAVRMIHDEPLTLSEVEERQRRYYADRKKLSQIFGEAISRPNLSNQGRRLEDKFSTRDRIHELIRWWRWCGELGVASRSMDKASRSLARALFVAKEAAWSYQADAGSLGNFELTGWTLKRSEPYRVHLETLYSLQQAAYCLMLQAQAVERNVALLSNEQSTSWLRSQHERIPALLLKAEEMAIKGLEFIEQVLNSGQEREDHDFELHWCKSRLLMMGALASMREPERKRIGRHSMSLLGDAAACLSNATPDRWRSDLALVDLRRAEIRLQEAAGVRLYRRKGDPPDYGFPFEAWTFDRLFGKRIDRRVIISKPQRGVNREMPSPKRVVEDLERDLKDHSDENKEMREGLQVALRDIKARATDALRYLDRAEPILRERRRNVWWTTWYFERRLRAISMILWASIVDDNEPIPFIGLEAAMRLSDSEPDVLLMDTLRMVRADSYRMAMVTLSYASCARALQIRLRIEKEKARRNSVRRSAVQLPERLQTMRANLDKACSQLIDISKFRNDGLPPEACIATDVEHVIDAVIARVKDVLQGLPRPRVS